MRPTPSSSGLQTLRKAPLRANPRYELIPFDHLPPQEQELLGSLRGAPGFFGLLRPRAGEAGLGVKSVCRDTALLFYALQRPGSLPSYLHESLDAEEGSGLAELVLDGVLEIAAGGGFVSGVDAHPLLYGAAPETAGNAEPPERIARLSIAALRYGERLETGDAAELSHRLYTYNRLPVSPGWKRRLATRGELVDFLGVGRGSRTRQRLDRSWRRGEPAGPEDPWLTWTPRDGVPRGTGWKLYLSPLPEHLPAAVAAVAALAAVAGGAGTTSRHRPAAFKVGADLGGILRPDKLVLYFDRFDALSETAAALRRELAGCPAQGVPFSAGLDDDGLLSWGTDPPRDERTVPWLQRESWRLRITNRLAVALLAARDGGRDSVRDSVRDGGSRTVEPWRFALERLRLEGVDTATWTPAPGTWQGPAA